MLITIHFNRQRGEMMQVFLVAVEGPVRRRWHVSLDPALQADAYWWRLRDPAVRLWRTVQRFPLGRALAMAHRLNGAASSRAARRLPAGDRPADEPILIPVRLAADTEARLSRLAAAGMDKLAEAMGGRALLAEEFASLSGALDGDAGEHWHARAQWGLLEGSFTLRTAVAVSGRFGRKRAKCLRCGAGEEAMRRTACASCGERCPYCERCLGMGRARACTPLISGAGPVASGAPAATGTRFEPEERDRAVAAALAAVPGLSLSTAQQAAAAEGVRHVLSGSPGKSGTQAPSGQAGAAVRPFLIWAVTGAGKTEMIFPLIAAERNRGGRVLVATPRKDVVLELLPRISAAFPAEQVSALYGGSGRRWPAGGIIVATTHQLLRYEAAFDLVVLDEVDAFPYHGDPMLAHAARKACRPGAAFVMLSATPPLALQRAVRRGALPCAKVPVRYHGHPLPVPACMRPARLAGLLAQSLARGAQAFVFVPHIARLEPELARLRRELAACCPPGLMDATSSRDPRRDDKVRRLRSGDIRILLTTTILERGVTIPKADVYIMDADNRLFDAPALVQMAGRAGRSARDPAGRVVFLSNERTREQRRAIGQIRMMNRLARRAGFLVQG